MDRAFFNLETKALSEAGEFSGLGSYFGNVDHGMDVVEKGAFEKSLKRHSKNGTLPTMLYGHDSRKQIGDFISMEETDRGLDVMGLLWIDGNKGLPPDQDALKAYRGMKGSGVKGLSIGYSTTKYDFDDKGVRHIKEAELFEVSYTPFPMNPKATVSRVKSLVSLDGGLLDIRTMEDVLRDAGLSHKRAKALLSGGYKALCRDDSQDINGTDIEAIQSIINNLNAFKG